GGRYSHTDGLRALGRGLAKRPPRRPTQCNGSVSVTTFKRDDVNGASGSAIDNSRRLRRRYPALQVAGSGGSNGAPNAVSRAPSKALRECAGSALGLCPPPPDCNHLGGYRADTTVCANGDADGASQDRRLCTAAFGLRS